MPTSVVLIQQLVGPRDESDQGIDPGQKKKKQKVESGRAELFCTGSIPFQYTDSRTEVCMKMRGAVSSFGGRRSHC